MAAVACVATVAAIAGCGGSDGASPAPSAKVATTAGQPAPAQAVPVPTTTATAPAPATRGDGPTPTAGPAKAADKPSSRSAATSRRPATKKVKAKPPANKGAAKAPAAPTDGGTPVQEPKPQDGGTPLAPTAPTGTAQDPPGSNPPLDCLEQAGLKNPVKYMNNLWGAKAAGDADILVDGPYGSAEGAQHSASTLEGVTRAEPGGRYVVSAALTADVGAEVTAVARCLKETKPVGELAPPGEPVN